MRSPERMHSSRTAGAKSEEGVGDGRSVWPEFAWDTRGLQCAGQWDATP